MRNAKRSTTLRIVSYAVGALALLRAIRAMREYIRNGHTHKRQEQPHLPTTNSHTHKKTQNDTPIAPQPLAHATTTRPWEAPNSATAAQASLSRSDGAARRGAPRAHRRAAQQQQQQQRAAPPAPPVPAAPPTGHTPLPRA